MWLWVTVPTGSTGIMVPGNVSGYAHGAVYILERDLPERDVELQRERKGRGERALAQACHAAPVRRRAPPDLAWGTNRNGSSRLPGKKPGCGRGDTRLGEHVLGYADRHVIGKKLKG